MFMLETGRAGHACVPYQCAAAVKRHRRGAVAAEAHLRMMDCARRSVAPTVYTKNKKDIDYSLLLNLTLLLSACFHTCMVAARSYIQIIL